MGSNSNSSTQTDSFEYRKIKNRQEMNKQWFSFGLSIFLTIIAFIAVATEAIPVTFTIPFILLLAVIQVVFQLYYFMHMKHKGHETPAMFIWSGVLVAIVSIAGLTLLVWI